LISGRQKNRLITASRSNIKPVKQAKAGVIMTQTLAKRKRNALGIRINPKEGLWIKYQLGLRGITLTEFGRRYGCKDSTISAVLRGFRKSAPLAAALYRFLGYSSFAAMIAAARGKGGAV
jgi:hypothetical protein